MPTSKFLLSMNKFRARLWFWRRKESYAEEILADSPLAYWPLGWDDASGNAVDPAYNPPGERDA